MALVLARSRARLVRLLRPLILLPLVLPPVVGASRCFTHSAGSA
ncbi:hypothetical protein NIIDMKKI_34630 [Mycobacterium kansasii]|uniref:Uncharacterized protein n=2 Tax=Mycobacterium kansasii TaxID=1768 RepID=A0A7G1IBK3_MYCKA|nr:hypothetical protein NIIDMKKI_34630 [Mycobacterium kansasii]